ncbi:MAG: sortase [Microgenomates group bacterium]
MPHDLKNATPIHHHIKRAKQKEYASLLFLRTLGNFLIISSLFFIARTLYEPVKQEALFFVNQWTNKTFVIATKEEEMQFFLQKGTDTKGSLTRNMDGKTAQVLVPEDPNFSIVIPKIGANARVITGVDTANERAYSEALKKGVAQALGTAFPGEGGHVFLFAHSTDYWWNVSSYNAIFYLLGKLVVGDDINIFYKGERYVYRVVGSKVVDPSEVEYITRKTNTEFLTLQTCWPLGTTFKRLLIFATRVAN